MTTFLTSFILSFSNSFVILRTSFGKIFRTYLKWADSNLLRLQAETSVPAAKKEIPSTKLKSREG
jgi:hypothetical protein